MSRNYLSKNDELRRGDYLMSNNGQWKAIFQDDGNFVIYGWKPTWASDTDGSDATRLVMQTDCNLVMYNNNDQARWSTSSYKQGNHVCRLQLTDEGVLRLHQDNQEMWNSTQNRGRK